MSNLPTKKDASRVGSIAETYAKFVLQKNGYHVTEPPFEGRGYDLLASLGEPSPNNNIYRIQVRYTSKESKKYRFSRSRHVSNEGNGGRYSLFSTDAFDYLLKVTPTGVFVDSYQDMLKRMGEHKSCSINMDCKIGDGLDISEEISNGINIFEV